MEVGEGARLGSRLQVPRRLTRIVKVVDVDGLDGIDRRKLLVKNRPSRELRRGVMAAPATIVPVRRKGGIRRRSHHSAWESCDECQPRCREHARVAIAIAIAIPIWLQWDRVPSAKGADVGRSQDQVVIMAADGDLRPRGAYAGIRQSM